MTALSVNVNKIAWLRNAREGSRPDLIDSCRAIVEAGAQGITVHPRPDQRHIRPADVQRIYHFLAEQDSDVEYNIEGNPEAGAEANGYPGFLSLVKEIQPTQCTLVPDASDQLTSDHGFDLMDSKTFERTSQHIALLKSLGIRVSLFLDPDARQVECAAASGTDRIELYTGPWADLVEERGLETDSANASLDDYRKAAKQARDLGLGVNAGHDLNLHNLQKFCSIGGIDEVSIGHALIADALDYGLKQTVGKYLQALA